MGDLEEERLDVVNILRTLWLRRLWLLGGVFTAAVLAYSVVFEVELPPRFESRSIEYGAASTTLLLDAGLSPLLNVEADIDPLANRAEIFTRLVESDDVRRHIADAGGFDPYSIVVIGRIASSQTFTRSSREAAAEQRALQVAGEGQVRRLLFASEQDLPVLSIFATAATAEEAVALADAGAKGLSTYVSRLQARQSVPAPARVEFRQLGPAVGGVVNEGASAPFAVVVFVGVFTVWCLFVLFGSSLVAAMRAEKSQLLEGSERLEPAPEGDVLEPCPSCGEPRPLHARFCPNCGEDADGRSTVVPEWAGHLASVRRP